MEVIWLRPIRLYWRNYCVGYRLYGRKAGAVLGGVVLAWGTPGLMCARYCMRGCDASNSFCFVTDCRGSREIFISWKMSIRHQ